MRKDQIEDFKPLCLFLSDKIFSAMFSEIGVNKMSDIIPNTEEFLEGMIKAMHEDLYTEEEIDEILAFNKKFHDKNILAGNRSEQFTLKYFTDNLEVIEAMIGKFQGE